MNKIQEKIEKGYDFEGNQVYEDTFNIYKKMAIPAGAILLLILMLFGGVYMVSLFTIFESPKEIQSFLQSLALLDLSPEITAYYILTSATINGIMAIFGAGFIKMARDVYHNELPKFGTAFSFFTKIEGLNVFIFTLILQIIFSSISLGLEYAGLSLVNYFVLILMHLLTLLVVPFIIFDKLSVFKAVGASISLVNQKPFKIMMYLILLGAFALMGVFMFVIGIIFTLPIFYCFNYSIYENIVNKN